jgi:hypothetical protein
MGKFCGAKKFDFPFSISRLSFVIARRSGSGDDK